MSVMRAAGIGIRDPYFLTGFIGTQWATIADKAIAHKMIAHKALARMREAARWPRGGGPARPGY
jgi:hypothetical protein